jgi:transposase-like protein
MTISFARHQFPPEIIRHAVWLYVRFTLSYRDVEDLLAERNLDISYETVRRWVLKFGPLFAQELRRRRPRPTSRWHLDEMAATIAGGQFWLWRAVDDEGEVLDLLVQRRRDKTAAVKLMRKLLKKQSFAPDVLVTDKLRSYSAAKSEIGLSARHEQGLRANNRAENSHRRHDDASARCSVSNRPDQPNASCLFTPPSKTRSTSNAISHPAAPSACSETKCSGRGEPPPPPEPELRLPIFTRPKFSSRDSAVAAHARRKQRSRRYRRYRCKRLTVNWHLESNQGLSLPVRFRSSPHNDIGLVDRGRVGVAPII